MKKKIKIWYTDFYRGFDPYNNYLTNLLSQSFDLEIDSKDPEYLVFSCYGQDFLQYPDCVRIFYTGENLVPDFNLCDYAIGFHFFDFGDRYLRYPNFALMEDQLEELVRPKSFGPEDLDHKAYFCNFIYSNSEADHIRDRFFHLLSRYKTVQSPGRHLKNSRELIGDRFKDDWMYSKLDFQRKCKFSIAFENSSSPGYTTEKIMHAFITGTIPIYWGNPEISRDFNPEAFINCHDFSSLDQVVEKIIQIDTDPELYLSILNQPPFRHNELPQHLRQSRFQDFLKRILDQDNLSARRRPKYGNASNYERTLQQKFGKRGTYLGKIRRFFS